MTVEVRHRTASGVKNAIESRLMGTYRSEFDDVTVVDVEKIKE